MRHFKFLLLLISLSACELNNKEILTTKWKYVDGYYLGDLIDFNNGYYRLSKDTIFIGSKKEAIIIDSRKRFDGLFELKIIDINKREKGNYISI